MDKKFDNLREYLLNGLFEVKEKKINKQERDELTKGFSECSTCDDLAKTIRKIDRNQMDMIVACLNAPGKKTFEEFQAAYLHSQSQNTSGAKSHHESGVASKSTSYVTSINVQGNQQIQHTGACFDEKLKMDPKGDSRMRMDVEELEKVYPKQEWHDLIGELKGCFQEKEELYRQAEEKLKEKEASGKLEDKKPASNQNEQQSAQNLRTAPQKSRTPPPTPVTEKPKNQNDPKSLSMNAKRDGQVPDTKQSVQATTHKSKKPQTPPQNDPTPTQKAKPQEHSGEKGHGDREWETKLKKLEKHLEAREICLADYEEEIKDTFKRLEKAKITENDLRAELRKETDMKEIYKGDVDVLTVQKNDLQEKLNLQQEEINESEKEKSNIKNELKKLFKENKSLQKELDFQKQKYEEDMKAKNKQLEQLKIEKDDYRDRFSKMAGDRLTDKNADIADLSDPNRAMKLSEKFSGLYDDEWTDAFQTLCDNKMPKKDALQLLVRILKSCYDSCEFIATQQIATLTENLLSPVQTVGKVTKEQAGIKTKPRLGSKNERILKDARRQMWEASIDVIKQSLLEQTKEWMDKEIGQKAFEDIKLYTEKCVEICWLMVIHEPPIYMKTETTPDENIDPNIYTPYSASGKKIDFLVWPPLYNGKGGGLLSKGVVELIKTVKK